MPTAEIERLATGEALLSQLTEKWWSALPDRWHPEELAFQPELYLDGVDPEYDNFGIRSALELWLDLHKKGLMDTGIVKNSHLAFQKLFDAKSQDRSPG